ncbi:MAG: DUF3313 family protein [Gammaproteobacteria bacterium]|nr:DUF3313 family protein [Gammaproteobacteria bacterium]
MRCKPASHWLLCLALFLAAPAFAADDGLPQTSHDGLVLQQSKTAQVLYLRPGVDFSAYKRVAILDCPVAFKKDWQRDQNRSGQRITQKEMDKIKANLSAEFLKVFTDELQNKGGYEIVTEGAADVIVLRPAIIDLDVTAPDTMDPGRSFTVSASAGAMTLYLEVYDSVSSQILARAIDRKAGMDTGIQWRNGVTNKADADRILRRWADTLRKRLDAVHGKTGT